MACCGGSFYDGEAPPACADLENVEANGYVELKLVKRRKLVKRSWWCARYCALSDGRLYFYKDMKGKSYDPETFVIDLRDTIKISVRSYVARETDTEMALTAGCAMSITDRRKRKHKLRFGTGEERQYWTGHLAKATGKAIADFEDKPVKRGTLTRSIQQADSHSVNEYGQEQPACVVEDDTSKPIPSKEAGADELAEKRRNAADYVKWLQRRGSMLERRERDLCAEIESILPVRTHSAASALNTAVPISATWSIGEQERPSVIIPEVVVVEKLDDRLESELECELLPSSTLDTCLSVATAIDAATIIEDHVTGPAEIKQPEIETPTPKPLDQKKTAALPARQPPPVPKKPVFRPVYRFAPPLALPPIETVSSKKPVGPLILKMHEIFSAGERLPCPTGSQNLRTLLGTTGTMQFPGYRRSTPAPQCHKLITPPRPKWWIASQQLAQAGKLGSTSARFKFDRSANPVWKALNEKSQDLSSDGK